MWRWCQSVIDIEYIMRYYIQIVIIIATEREYMNSTTCTSQDLPRCPGARVTSFDRGLV